MFRSLQIGTAFGIPLYLHTTLLLLPLWAWWLNRSAGIGQILFAEGVLATVFFCVLLHELGHALMARFFGIGTRDITLYPIGGVARLESTGSQPHEEVCIALAGPAVNLVLVLLLAPLVLLAYLTGALQLGTGEMLPSSGGPLAVMGSFLFSVLLGNMVLLLFNLLPAFPMDGGRVVRAVLSLFFGHLRATAIAAWVGLAFAGGLTLLGIVFGNPSLVLVSLFVGFAGQMELRAARHYSRATEPVLVVEPLPEPVYAEREPFTGFLWDRDQQMWVRWVDGRPFPTSPLR